MRPIAAHVAWSVYVCVCVCVGNEHNTRMNRSRFRSRRGLWTLGPKEPYAFYWGPDPSLGGALLGIHHGHAQNLPAVDIFNCIRKGAAAMRHLATSTVATCLMFALATSFHRASMARKS